MSDYISREKLAKKATHYEIAGFKTANVVLLKDVMELPTADVKAVVRGKWLHKEAYDFDEERWSSWAECSECGELAPVNGLGKYERANYCPNCGADMREE